MPVLAFYQNFFICYQTTFSLIVISFRSVDGYLREYDLRLGKLTEDCMGESVTSVSFTNDGQCLLASSLDSRIRLIDRYSGELLNRYAMLYCVVEYLNVMFACVKPSWICILTVFLNLS